jgi:hypothetical protein
LKPSKRFQFSFENLYNLLIHRFPFHKRTLNLGGLYTRSQGSENLGPTLSILGLLFGPKLLINARTLIINDETVAPRVANWLPKFNGILFSALGPIHSHKVQHLLVTWGRLKSFSLLQP